MINLQEAESVIPFQLNGIVPRLFKLSYLKTYTKTRPHPHFAEEGRKP